MPSDPRPSSVVDIRTTEVLLRRAQAGDTLALADLFERYQDRILRYAKAKVGPRLAAKVQIEDIVQEVRLRAWKELQTFDPRQTPRLICWLGAIATNCIRDELNRLKPEMRNPDREVPIESLRTGTEDGGPIPIASLDPTPSQYASAQELADIYDRCVHSLSDRRREVVLLKDYADMSWQDIADRIGSPSANAAFGLYSRAMDDLKEKLRLEGFPLPSESTPE